jgi:hypothetical protein
VIPDVLEAACDEGDAILLPEIGAYRARILLQPLQQLLEVWSCAAAAALGTCSSGSWKADSLNL